MDIPHRIVLTRIDLLIKWRTWWKGLSTLSASRRWSINVGHNSYWYYQYMWHTFKLVLVLSPSYGVWFCLFHPRRTCLLFLVKQFLSLCLLISPPVHRWLEGSMREGVCEQLINFKEFFVCKGQNLSASLLLTATPRPERDFDIGIWHEGFWGSVSALLSFLYTSDPSQFSSCELRSLFP